MKRWRAGCVAVAGAVLGLPPGLAAGAADEPQADKSRFTLLNPTPRGLMREMTTDRPDKTEVPFTVDAGHVQVETDILSYGYDWQDGVRTDSWAAVPSNFRVGMLNSTELGVIVEPYLREQSQTRDGSEMRQGFGTVTLRLKQNLWGNDGGTTALAVMPYISLPTSSDDLGPGKVEAGLVIPLAIELPHGLSAGLMTEANCLLNDDGKGYHFESVNTASLAGDLTDKLGGFIEIFTAVDTQQAQDWIATLDLGITYAVTGNLQLDTGVYIGLTESAEDVVTFVGMSIRH